MHFVDLLLDKTIRLSLDGKEYKKIKLGNFFKLEKFNIDLTKAALKHNKEEFRKYVKQIVELQTKTPLDENSSPLAVLKSVIEIMAFNRINPIPTFLVPPPKAEESNKKEPETKRPRWDYDGRYIAEWINAFAETYHWSLEQIFNLDLDLAAHLLQEIFINQQYKREWEYQTTPDLAYQYDQNSKSSKFVPLKRPYWMDDAMDVKIVKTKIPKSMLPAGVIVDLSGQGIISANVQEENESG